LSNKKAVFFDRDGVLVPSDIRGGRPYAKADLDADSIFPEAISLAADLKSAGYFIVVATNQPDVGSGKVTRIAVEKFHAILATVMAIDAIEVCYHVDADRCACRKPLPGMLLHAASKFGINLSQSFMVGDRWRDMDAGSAAGCKTVFLDFGYTERAPTKAPDHIIRHLNELRAVIV
jgi:D-glycero-D-manno-heptose 1,7-bisphosphate phosphatase